MADLLFDNLGDISGAETEDILIRLYKTLEVMLTSLNSSNVKKLETDKTKISSFLSRSGGIWIGTTFKR